MVIEVDLIKDQSSEELPYIEWYLTSNKSTYAPLLYPAAGEEGISQVETKFGKGANYHVQLQLTKKKKLQSLRNCSKDQSRIECAIKKLEAKQLKWFFMYLKNYYFYFQNDEK